MDEKRPKRRKDKDNPYARTDGKAIHNLMEKDKPFPTGLQTAFPQPRIPGSLRTFP